MPARPSASPVPRPAGRKPARPDPVPDPAGAKPPGSSPADHRALRLWLRLLACTGLIERRIRRQLATRFATTLPRFDLLAQLDREDGLTMTEASRRLMVTGGNLTGIADQLERDRWLRREPVSDDRRATRLRLTDAGRSHFEAMARDHEQWVVAMFASLDAAEQAELHRLLAKLKAGLDAGTNANA